MRRAIMVGLILLFFVISPIIVGYTAGYRYNFETREIQQTGVISVDIEPRDATVTINGTVVESAIPLRLSNLAPGVYHISITRAGRKSWEKDVTVESKQTTYIRGITLFEDALPIILLQDPSEKIDQVSFSPDGTQAIIIQHDEESENLRTYSISLFDAESGSARLLTRITSETTPEAEWSPFASRFALTETTENTHSITYGNPENDPALVHTISVPSSSSKMQWSLAANNPSLFIQSGDSIIELNDSRIRSLLFDIDEDVSAWRIDENQSLWTFSSNTMILTNEQFTYTLTEPIDTIIDTNQDRVIAANGDRILTISSEQNQTNQTISHAFNRWYSAPTKEWLVWTPWELTSIYANGNKEVLNRTSEPIRSVRPLDEYGLLLLATENKLLGFNPGFYVTHELFTQGSIYTVGVNQDTRKIFFHGMVGNRPGIFELSY